MVRQKTIVAFFISSALAPLPGLLWESLSGFFGTSIVWRYPSYPRKLGDVQSFVPDLAVSCYLALFLLCLMFGVLLGIPAILLLRRIEAPVLLKVIVGSLVVTFLSTWILGGWYGITWNPLVLIAALASALLGGAGFSTIVVVFGTPLMFFLTFFFIDKPNSIAR